MGPVWLHYFQKKTKTESTAKYWEYLYMGPLMPYIRSDIDGDWLNFRLNWGSIEVGGPGQVAPPAPLSAAL